MYATLLYIAHTNSSKARGNVIGIPATPSTAPSDRGVRFDKHAVGPLTVQMNTTTSKSTGALNSGFNVLETVINSPDGVSVTAIASELQSDKGNIHRILRSLEERGYVEQDQSTKLFSPSSKLYGLAGTLIGRQNLAVVARPFMQHLSTELKAPIHLARRIADGGVYIARVASVQGGLTVETEIGMQPSIHATATGKALFALATGPELQRVLHQPLTRFTNHTITDLDQFERELMRVQERGYAVDEEELNVGVSCVAAPIFNHNGDVIGSIGSSAAVMSVDAEKLHTWGKRMAETAAQITQQLGGQVPEAPTLRRSPTGRENAHVH